MSFTNTVIELTDSRPLTAVDIASKTALSIGYVRTQLRLMELSGVIERVDDRTPIYYRPAPNNYVASQVKEKSGIREDVDKAKKQLLAESKDSDTFVSDYLKKYPKSKWAGAADMLIAFGHALKELDDEGKLIDTL